MEQTSSIFFDRATEKLYRETESKLRADIRNKLDTRAEGNSNPVIAEPELVAPFVTLFDKLFVWQPGEYVAELIVEAEPGAALFGRKYRFTVYESDTTELRAHVNDYKLGGGISFDVDKHAGVFVPLSQHGS